MAVDDFSISKNVCECLKEKLKVDKKAKQK